jgi:hypothetical protein
MDLRRALSWYYRKLADGIAIIQAQPEHAVQMESSLFPFPPHAKKGLEMPACRPRNQGAANRASIFEYSRRATFGVIAMSKLQLHGTALRRSGRRGPKWPC